MNCKVSSLDVGCGWVQDQVKRGDIGVDLHRGKCDVVADAYHLPFQSGVFRHVFLWAVLEHLENPVSALSEVKRVAKADAKFTIMVPLDSNVWHVLLKRVVIEFPFGFVLAVQTLLRLRKLWCFSGAPHKRQVPLSFLEEHFEISSVKKLGCHGWLVGRKGKVFRKILNGRQLCSYDLVVEGRFR